MKDLWDILRNNDEHILVRSASSKRSRNYTTYLLNLIKTTPLLQHLSPRSNQRKSSELFDVNGANPSDSPTLLSAGISGTVTGLRATKAKIDDVEVVKNSTTPETRETLMTQVNENYNLLAESNGISGEVLVLGTFMGTDSIYVSMIRSGSFDCLIIPAEYPPLTEWYLEFVHEDILKVSRENPDMIGRAIDERLNDDFLAKRKLRAGKSNYELHYMLNPNLQDELKYPLKLKDLIVYDIDPIDNPIRFIYSSQDRDKGLKHRGFTSDYLVNPAWLSEERSKFQFTILAIDPSGKGEDETGYCVVSLMGGKIFIRDFGGVKGGYEDEALDNLVGLAMKYKANKIVGESNFGGGMYMRMLEKKLLEAEYNCETEDVRASKQKELRVIDTLEPLMNQHRIIIDRSALIKDFEKSSAYSFTYQLTHITKTKNSLQHDDIIDAVELAVSSMNDYVAVGEQTTIQQHQDDKAKEIIRIMKEGLFPELARGLNHNSNYGNKY